MAADPTTFRLRFELKGRPNARGLDSIRARYYIGGKRLNFPTDFRCPPNNWNGGQQKVKGGAEINGHLRAALTKADEVERAALRAGRALTEADALPVLALLTPTSQRAVATDEVVSDWIRANLTGKGGSPAAQESVANCLDDFRPGTKWHEMLTDEWFTAWIAWLETTRTVANRRGKKPKGTVIAQPINRDSTRKRYTQLGSLINRAHGIAHTLPYPLKWVKPARHKAQKVQRDWLNADQVREIEGANLPNKLHAARDLFLIGVYTGLAISDYWQVLLGTFTRDGALDTSRTKTSSTGTIYPTPKLDAIRDRYQVGLIPLVYSKRADIPSTWPADALRTTDNTVRAHLAEIGEQLGFTIQGSHTARRTFGRLLWYAGQPITVIQVALSHASPDETLTYLGLDQQEVRDHAAQQVKDAISKSLA